MVAINVQRILKQQQIIIIIISQKTTKIQYEMSLRDAKLSRYRRILILIIKFEVQFESNLKNI